MSAKPLIELSYYEGEDGLLYPDLRISEDEEYDTIPVGKFGRMWKDYMLEQHPFRVTELVFEGKINRIITEVDEEAENYKEELIQEILKKATVTRYRGHAGKSCPHEYDLY